MELGTEIYPILADRFRIDKQACAVEKIFVDERHYFRLMDKTIGYGG